MSIISADPWFGRGQTLGVNDPTQGGAVVGSSKVFTDTDPRTSNAGSFLSNRLVTCIAVRNTSGAALLGGTIVKFKKTAILDEVDGKAASIADAPLGVVDEYLPPVGVANGDIFWLVVSGPTAIMTSAAFAPGALVGAGANGLAVAGTAGTAIGVAISAVALGKVRTLTNVQTGSSISPVTKGADEDAPATEDAAADPAADVAALSATVEPVVAPVATPVVEPVVAPVVPEAAPVVEPVVAPEAPVVTEPAA